MVTRIFVIRHFSSLTLGAIAALSGSLSYTIAPLHELFAGEASKQFTPLIKNI